MDVFERVLPKTTSPNHSMLGSYPACIDPASYLEYARACVRVLARLKKGSKQKNRKSRVAKNTIFAENPYGRVLATVPPPLGYN